MKKHTYKGIHYKTGKAVALHVTGEKITGTGEIPHDLSLREIIIPGLADLQVNGYKGIDFNGEDLDVKKIRDLIQNLWATGVTTCFPTVITNSDTRIAASLQTIANACDTDKAIDNTIRGIHLEGPFISGENGPRGAHPEQFVKKPDWELFRKWQKISGNRIKLITLSPEWPEASGFIEKCTASGVLVSIGHTAATGEDIQKAVRAGARMSTHLGNAAHLQLPRHQNYIWEQLASDALWPTIIADGFHLPASVLKVFFRAKPEQGILVSDATQFAGLPPGTYDTHIGGKIVLDEKGRLFMKEHPGLLAGSARTLIQCIDFLTREKLLPLETAVDMTSVRPMHITGLEHPYGLLPGAPADFVILEQREKEIKVKQTVKSGEIVFQGQ
ncbi:N-acetylglucosamine-6-phosphate deacetylase [Sinomicrobium soli]|uniref:N-acetylglucosamine-6-phosphate deacetylase n=1 Tax=Sinomicrobium sp. N-1-3-6 TaxID=2219864 RepID=UPI000DCD84DB|nr:amidohydrolase family protein [Sinomicrobium sp. N-1-3-6]RAV30867.1 N-acetylglucosamine-6-phosphate deacetylase [Sinomicrobium sp. N-1-3-6]